MLDLTTKELIVKRKQPLKAAMKMPKDNARRRAVAVMAKQWDVVLGNQLESTCEERKISQKQLADFMGFERHTIAKIYKGRRPLRASELLIMETLTETPGAAILDRARHRQQSGSKFKRR